jgi:hypothetical protein
MKNEDSFFHRLGTDEPPFGEFNPKTLGAVLVGNHVHDTMHCPTIIA